MTYFIHMRKKWYSLIMDEIEFNEIKFKKTVLISRQILLYFVDFFAEILPLFDKYRTNRIPLKMYNDFRIDDKEKFSRELYRLKQAGLIKDYFKEKEHFIQLTTKGKKKLKRIIVDEIDFKISNKWDKKWRVVAFDVPNTKSRERDILRHKLETIGFYQLQKSVYVFPYECFKEIKLIRDMYFLGPNVEYLVVDRLETEADLITIFINKNILKTT